mmetsp:Transcript_1327/g.960  ORF Transcript_1327/g.960 Transcript_1327/m.960 type:complete len:125 (-) Transcript_1327:243-617(-)
MLKKCLTKDRERISLWAKNNKNRLELLKVLNKKRGNILQKYVEILALEIIISNIEFENTQEWNIYPERWERKYNQHLYKFEIDPLFNFCGKHTGSRGEGYYECDCNNALKPQINRVQLTDENYD